MLKRFVASILCCATIMGTVNAISLSSYAKNTKTGSINEPSEFMDVPTLWIDGDMS